VEVLNADTLEVALDLARAGLNPVVLNMANAKRPGGGYRSGAAAQEESLFRRSNYQQILEDRGRKFDPRRRWHYPLPDYGGVYCPRVMVFRGDLSDGYPFLFEPIEVAMIAVAAYARPRFDGNFAGRKTGKHKKPEHFRHEPVLTEHYAERTRLKIRAILNMAAEHGHRCLVLGAFGCGAFANPPRHIAKLFHEEIYGKHFRSCFSRIVFAIVDDSNTRKRHNPDGNLLPFQEQFAAKKDNSTGESQIGSEPSRASQEINKGEKQQQQDDDGNTVKEDEDEQDDDGE